MRTLFRISATFASSFIINSPCSYLKGILLLVVIPLFFIKKGFCRSPKLSVGHNIISCNTTLQVFLYTFLSYFDVFCPLVFVLFPI